MSVTAATITEDGTENEARVPSDTLKVVRGFTIQAGETTIATLDFDAEKSVVVQGTGRYQLKPVIKLLVRKEGEPDSLGSFGRAYRTAQLHTRFNCPTTDYGCYGRHG